LSSLGLVPAEERKMKRENIDAFEKTQTQMEALHEEVAALARKTPNDAVNKFKLGLINKIVQAANRLLSVAYKPFADFDSFDESSLPTSSDVTLILAQYLNCMEKYRADNIYKNINRWYWRTASGQVMIETSPPKKLKEK
jgi:hypothetical protein